MAHKKKKNFRKPNPFAERQNRRPKSPTQSFGNINRRNIYDDFTLEDVAKNTKKKDGIWKSNKKLRHSKIAFVSAGNLESNRPKDTAVALARLKVNSHADSSPSEVQIQLEIPLAENSYATPGQGPSKASCGPGFVIDLNGTKPFETGLPPPFIRSPSPTPSDSSEEVILFKGRNYHSNYVDANAKDLQSSTEIKIGSDGRVIEDDIQGQKSITRGILLPKYQPTNSAKNPSFLNKCLSEERSKKLKSFEGNFCNVKDTTNEEEGLMDDYLQNMSPEDSNLIFTFASRDLGGNSLGNYPQAETSSTNGNRMEPTGRKCDSPILQDFDDLSTTKIIKGEIQEILAQRNKNLEVQYLVVWKDFSIREAQWVPKSSLTNDDARSMIKLFKDKEKLSDKISDGISDQSSDRISDPLSDNLSGLISDDTEDEEFFCSDELSDSDQISTDEEDENIFNQNIDRLCDEDIARILAKQEELGMKSDKILLFDDTLGPDVGFTDKLKRKKKSSIGKNKAKKRGSKQNRWNDPLTSHLFGISEELEFLKSEPPLKRGKGRKGKFLLSMSDPELEKQLETCWQNDRAKKSRKKLERENLRDQGLLGMKNGKTDLKQKYRYGMSNQALKKEIKVFLRSQNSSLSLPPMKKADRKFAHEVANAFNLRSKSAGFGNNRFPIFYRTSRTSNFREEIFDTIEANIACRLLPHTSFRRKKTGLKGASKHGSRNEVTKYQDGDIVGGSAPEIASDNKGREMLEKMGWSKGTALGALDNKGILQPVIHIVKTTKAGLG